MPDILAGQSLEKWAQSSDPITRYLSRRAMSDRDSGDRLQELMCMQGPAEGAGKRLKSLASVSRINGPELKETLDALQSGLASEPPSDAILRSLVWLASKHLVHSQADLPPEKRSQAPVEQDLSLAARACSMLRQYGQVEGDLEAALLEGRVPVRGLKLELEAPPRSASPEARSLACELLTQIPVLGERQGVTRLHEMAGSEPQRAAETARAMLEEFTAGRPSDEQLQAFARMLQDSASRSELAALWKPHHQALLEIPHRAEALGIEGSGILKVCSALWDLLPAPLPESLVASQIGPILGSASWDDLNWGVRDLCKLVREQPHLAGSVARETLSHLSGRHPEGSHFQIFQSALKAGWKPDPLEKDWLTSWMVPAGAGDITRYTFTAPALQLALTLKEQDPHALDGLRLSDSKGQLVPYQSALLSHLMQSNKEERGFMPQEGSSGWEGARACFALLAPEPDPALEKLLLEPLVDLPTRLLESSPRVRNHLAVLASIPLTPETRSRLEELTAACLPYPQSHFEPLVAKARGRELEKAQASLCSTDLQERLEGAARCLELKLHHDEPFLDPAVSAALSTVESASESEKAQLRTWLGSRLVGLEGLDGIPARGLAHVVLGACLASADEGLEMRLRAICQPKTRSSAAYFARDFVHQKLSDRDRERLGNAESDQERGTLLQRIQEAEGSLSEQTLEIWSKSARGWAAELIPHFGPDELGSAASAYLELVETGEPEQQWSVLQPILNRVEMAGLLGQPLALPGRQAMAIWRRSRELGDVEQALREHGLESASGGAGISEGSSFVAVGGSVVRRRNRT